MIPLPDCDLDEEKLIKYVEDNYEIEQFEQIIKEFSVVAWDFKMQHSHLKKWLNNFDGRVLNNEKVEKILAMWILMNYTYYSEKEIRALCKCIFEDYIHDKILEFKLDKISKKKRISDQIQDIIDNTLFLSLGNPSESGTNILYYFRQENALQKESFEIDDRKKPYENVVFIDDVTISGHQACEYLNGKTGYGKKKYLLTLIATEKADKFIRENCIDEITLISSILIDDRSICFTDSSFVFSDKKMDLLKGLAEKLCIGYGNRIDNKFPLGYSDGQQLFGFFYNTPDNTLPIIWATQNNWIAAFPRYDKNPFEGAGINESKYI